MSPSLAYLLFFALMVSVIAITLQLAKRGSGSLQGKVSALSDDAAAAPKWSQRYSATGRFQGQTFGLSEITYRARDIRTMFVAANDLAPRFSAEVNYELAGMLPFNRTIEPPDHFRGVRFSTDEPEILQQALRTPFGDALKRVLRSPETYWVACIATSDQRRHLIGFERYFGPESDVLILRKSWRIGNPEPDAKHDLELLTELSKQMRATAFTGERAAVPSLTRLFARGVWSTFVLFWIVVAGFILFFFIIWQIASRL